MTDPISPTVETAHLERLLNGIAEIYQVVGALADKAGEFDNPQVIKALDWLSDPESTDCDVLPFNLAAVTAEATPPASSEMPRAAPTWTTQYGHSARLAKAMKVDATSPQPATTVTAEATPTPTGGDREVDMAFPGVPVEQRARTSSPTTDAAQDVTEENAVKTALNIFARVRAEGAGAEAAVAYVTRITNFAARAQGRREGLEDAATHLDRAAKAQWEYANKYADEDGDRSEIRARILEHNATAIRTLAGKPGEQREEQVGEAPAGGAKEMGK